jgi:hypothetical protein
VAQTTTTTTVSEQPIVIAVVQPANACLDTQNLPLYVMPTSNDIALELITPYMNTSTNDYALAHNNILLKHFVPQIAHFIDTMLVPNQALSYKNLNLNFILDSALMQFGFK